VGTADPERIVVIQGSSTFLDSNRYEGKKPH
jgi:hypothetical protein